ncbi:MATE family efflux transporter [Bacteroidales bacterium OttesenSCG-928-C19]|nr:MATE family efflux transporter [Bacteroidales bacterium OttesenSCG-928-C19]
MSSNLGVRNLTEGPIFKQLLGIALPIMATNFIQMAYTLTDMAWVGRLGSKEVAAIGSVGILVWLVSSFAILTKIAAEISIARAIGKNNISEARHYASHTVTIAMLLGIIIALLLFSLSPLIVSFFKHEAHIATMATSYLQIVACAMPLSFLANAFSGIYNGAGRTTIPFYLIASGLLFNMVLDPLFIFGVGPFEGMGTNGAGVATVIAQLIVVILFVWQMKRSNGILNRFPYFIKPKKTYTTDIFKLGAPIALMNCLMAAIGFYIARIASVVGGHLAVMSQTTGSQIEGITWNTSNGFSTALGTFVAQNYAAGKPERAQKAYKYTLITLLSFGLIITACFILFGEEIFGVFVPEAEARIAGGNYLFILSFCQVFMMLESTTLGMWNGSSQTTPPAVISIVFNLLRIPMALWLANIYGINGVWITMTVTAIMKGLCSFLVWTFRRRKV